MTKDDKRSFRATFLDTKSSQQKLLEWVNNLIEENRPIKVEKRQQFLRLLANATLGEGYEIDIPHSTKKKYIKNVDWEVDGKGDKVKPEKVGDIIRFAVFEGRKKIPKLGRKNEGTEIKELWKTIRSLLLRIFPRALQVAVRSSQEIISREETKVWDYGARSK